MKLRRRFMNDLDCEGHLKVIVDIYWKHAWSTVS